MGGIGKLFGGGEEGKPAPGAAQVLDAPGRADAPEPASGAEVDAAWYRWLVSAGWPAASPDLENHILAELARLAQSPASGAALVPRVPEIIPQLLRTLRDENMNAADLSRQLSRDVVLVAEVYREANLPRYRPRYHSGPPVDSMEAAIMLLGQNGMRMLLARVALRPVMSMQDGVLAKRAAPLVWSQSEKCALAASILAPAARANAFEAYLAGLIENVGLVVALRLVDLACKDGALPQSDEFIAALFRSARLLSARIARLWDFPETVVEAIGRAGRPDAPVLAQTLALADRLGNVPQLVDAARIAAGAPPVTAGPAARPLLPLLGPPGVDGQAPI